MVSDCNTELQTTKRAYSIAALFFVQVTEIGAQLQAVMQKNPKKARHTCTKEYKARKKAGLEELVEELGQEAEPVPMREAEVWEISEGEDDSPHSGSAGRKPDCDNLWGFVCTTMT